MEEKEKKENSDNPQTKIKFKRLNQRHSSLRLALCENKETQLKNLLKIDIDGIKRHSLMIGLPNKFQMNIFNFEKEEADEDDEVNNSDIEEEKHNDNDIEEPNPIDAFKIKQKKEKEKGIKETKMVPINEIEEEIEKRDILQNCIEESNNEKEEKGEIQEFFEPLNEKGELRIPLKSKNKYKRDNFHVISLSGKGAYGTVLKVKFKGDKSDNFYAIKVMDIMALDRIKKLYQAYLECDILSQLESPYIVDILGSFNENGKIYIVMQYLSKGDFSDFIRLNYPLKLETIKFYVAEIVNFLEYIQSKKIVHRDLKPENIMMDSKWHLKVIDFATAKILGKYFDKTKMLFKTDSNYDIIDTDDIKGKKVVINEEEDDFYNEHGKPEKRGMTFVGTAEYVSPEVLGDKPAGFGSDIWALGIIIYQMFCGKTPFKEKTNYLIFRKIEQLQIEFPSNINIPEEAKDLITKILVKEHDKRLGAGESGTEYDISHLKNHPFFKGIDWNNLHNITPPNSENFDSLMNKKNNYNNIVNQQNYCDLEFKQKKEEKMNNINSNNNNFGEEQALILRKGYLDKKSPWLHYNKRKVILYSTPKLVYIDPTNNIIKGEINLDKNYKINHVSMTIFDLVSPKRVYRFKATDDDVLVWEKTIIEAIKKYGK